MTSFGDGRVRCIGLKTSEGRGARASWCCENRIDGNVEMDAGGSVSRTDCVGTEPNGVCAGLSAAISVALLAVADRVRPMIGPIVDVSIGKARGVAIFGMDDVCEGVRVIALWPPGTGTQPAGPTTGLSCTGLEGSTEEFELCVTGDRMLFGVGGAGVARGVGVLLGEG